MTSTRRRSGRSRRACDRRLRRGAPPKRPTSPPRRCRGCCWAMGGSRSIGPVCLATLRLVFNWAVVAHSSTRTRHGVRQPMPARSESIIPFEDWAEVDRRRRGVWPVGGAHHVRCRFGARPGELVRLEHRHVEGDRVYLPGTKTAQRSAGRPSHRSRRRGVSERPPVDRDAACVLRAAWRAVVVAELAVGRLVSGAQPRWLGEASALLDAAHVRGVVAPRRRADPGPRPGDGPFGRARSRSEPMASGPTRWGHEPRTSEGWAASRRKARTR